MPQLAVVCAARTHCAACRDPGPKGDRFRASLAAGYSGVPADWPACPEGKPWGLVACARCGADWHARADCPIPEGYEPTAANAVEGGCGCSPPPPAATPGDE